MIPPSKLRKKIVVLALSPKRSRALVIKGEDDRWHLPDSHLHWPIGRKKATPIFVCAQLARDATIGLLGEVSGIKRQVSKYGKRHKLPTGGFVFSIPSTENFLVDQAVDYASRAKKFLNLIGRIEMRSIEDIKNDSFAEYGGTSIEAVHAYLSVSV